VDVEHGGPVALLLGCEQIEQQRAQARLIQHRGDVPVAWAGPAAATAVREDDDLRRAPGNGQVPRQTCPDPVNAVLYYAHEVLLPALGWHLSWQLRHLVGLTGATVLAGGFIVIVLAAVVVTQPGRCRVFVVTAVATGLVFTAVTSAFAWGGPGQRVTIRVEHG